jgi:DNA-binding response OmpR family regulator
MPFEGKPNRSLRTRRRPGTEVRCVQNESHDGVISQSAQGESPRILLADDDPGVRESLAAVLNGEGYTVLAAKDGQEALGLCSGVRIDLVMLDLNMPGKSGWDAFERMTAENPLLPVIIITGRPNQLFTALGAGVGALLEKPVDITMLLRTVKALLAESPETRLARMTGCVTDFHYLPQGGSQFQIKEESRDVA